MSSLFVVFLMGFLNVEIGAQIASIRPCPAFKTQPNFDLERYMGRWYEMERYFAVFEFGGKCVTADYTLVNGTVKVVNNQISAITGLPASIEGVGKPAGEDGEAKLSVVFPSLPIQFEAPYWVLSTDYDSYAIVWSCVNLGFFTVRNAWILTRVATPPASTVEMTYAILERLGVGRLNFMKTDQIRCGRTANDVK